MTKFEVLTKKELVEINGGKGWGWVGLIQPAYDFCCGVAKGFTTSCKKCK